MAGGNVDERNKVLAGGIVRARYKVLAEPPIARPRRSLLAVLPPKLYFACLQRRQLSCGAKFATRNISGDVSRFASALYKTIRSTNAKKEKNNQNILKGNPAVIIILNVFDGRFHYFFFS